MAKCYYCGGKSTSDEHAPPKQMFKGFGCDSITVRSCDAHNTRKSQHDQSIVSAFLIPLYNMRLQGKKFHPDVDLAIAEGKSAFPYTKRAAISTPFLGHPLFQRAGVANVAYIVPEISLDAWIRQLTAALVAHAMKPANALVSWTKGVIWSPDWLRKPRRSPVSLEYAAEQFRINHEIARALDSELRWHEGWSAQPRPYPSSIFNFRFAFPYAQAIVFRHRFYGTYRWYAAFEAEAAVVNALERKVG